MDIIKVKDSFKKKKHNIIDTLKNFLYTGFLLNVSTGFR